MSVSLRRPSGSGSGLARLARLAWTWGPAIVVMGTIFGLSSLRNISQLPGDISDKSAHFAGYAVLGVTVLRALAGARWAGVTGATALASWGICLLYGASDELHQRFVAGRTMAFDDWLADAAGSAAAIVVVWLVAAVVGTGPTRTV